MGAIAFRLVARASQAQARRRTGTWGDPQGGPGLAPCLLERAGQPLRTDVERVAAAGLGKSAQLAIPTEQGQARAGATSVDADEQLLLARAHGESIARRPAQAIVKYVFAEARGVADG